MKNNEMYVNRLACQLWYDSSCFSLYVIQEMEGISDYSKICSVKLVVLENILSGYNVNACQLGQVELDDFLKLISNCVSS